MVVREAADQQVVEAMRGIAEQLVNATEGKGYALFIAVKDARANYISNADRQDVVKMLSEWLEKTSGELYPHEGSRETPEARDVRLAHERKCAEIGRTLSSAAPIVFFMFDFGQGGNLAYFTNIPDARGGIEQFCRQEQGRS
jgi:hypothetical protein